MNAVLKDIFRFFKGHWPHLVVAIPAAVAFTALHELAHCVAVWVQGGAVTEFVWLPSGAKWGYMRYSFPSDAEYSEAAISLCPYAFWIAFCLFAGVLSLKRSAWPFWRSSTIFVWLFIAPVADIANAAVPYLIYDTDNDLRSAFGPIQSQLVLPLVGLGVAIAIYGYLLNKRLYRNRSVGLPAYCALAAIGALILVLGSSVRFT